MRLWASGLVPGMHSCMDHSLCYVIGSKAMSIHIFNLYIRKCIHEGEQPLVSLQVLLPTVTLSKFSQSSQLQSLPLEKGKWTVLPEAPPPTNDHQLITLTHRVMAGPSDCKSRFFKTTG